MFNETMREHVQNLNTHIIKLILINKSTSKQGTNIPKEI